MPTAVVLPDAELLVRTFLVGRSAITDIVGVDERGEGRVYTVIPNPAPTGPFLRLIRAAGPATSRRNIDRPLIQLDAYGGTKAQARNLVATVAAELEALEGATVAGVAGYCQGVDPGSERYIPDPDLQTERGRARERYILDVALVTRRDRS